MKNQNVLIAFIKDTEKNYQKKREKKMSLNYKILVTYEGVDSLETDSPVFDSINIPMEPKGTLVGRNAVVLATFFLVYKSTSSRQLMWVSMEKCYRIRKEENQNVEIGRTLPR